MFRKKCIQNYLRGAEPSPEIVLKYWGHLICMGKIFHSSFFYFIKLWYKQGHYNSMCQFLQANTIPT